MASGGDAEVARTSEAGGSSNPLSEVPRPVRAESIRLGRSVPTSADEFLAGFPS